MHLRGFKHDEVLAHAADLIVGRAAIELSRAQSITRFTAKSLTKHLIIVY